MIKYKCWYDDYRWNGIVPNWLYAYVLTNILSNLSGRYLGKNHRELEAGPP